MAPSHSLDPHFTPGTRLSRLPVRTGQESLEDFYRDLFANTGPEHERQRLLRALDEDLADAAQAKGRQEAVAHLEEALARIDAWRDHTNPLPQADRAELKRREAHNLLAIRPGLDLAAPGDGHSDAHAALLREVQDEHRAWRQGWAIGPGDAPYGRRPWSEPGHGQSRQPWDEQPDSGRPRQPGDPWALASQPWGEQLLRQLRGPADTLLRLGRGEAVNLEDAVTARAAQQPGETPEKEREQPRKTCWVVISEPTACERCLALAGKVYTEKPERPHPNCKCEIESREMTAREVRAFLDRQASRADAIRAEREHLEHERQAAKRPVDDSQWRKDGDPIAINGKDRKGRPAHGKFKGHALPDKTPGGIKIKTAPNADRRVTKEMRDTVQEVLDDPRCKQAGITDVTISAATNGKHESPEDRHYQGKAVDIAEINGKAIGKDEKAHTQAKALQDVIEERAKQGREIKDNLGPKYNRIYDTNGTQIPSRGKIPPHDDHVHIAIW